MSEPFSVRIEVRGYETDAAGHVNQAIYLQYAEHARWKVMEAGGVTQQDMLDAGVGPVVLETTVRYRKELTAGEPVDITCRFTPNGRTAIFTQTLRKADGTVAAEVEGVTGAMDMKRRRLLPDAARAFRELADRPELLGF